MGDNLYKWDNYQQEQAIGKREKEVYLMSRGYCLTYSEIARYLNFTCSIVKSMIGRAEKKIARQVNESLFCNWG